MNKNLGAYIEEMENEFLYKLNDKGKII